MASEASLCINAPFIKYVAENVNVTKPIEKELKRSIFERIDEGIGLNWLKTNIKKYTGITYLSDKITDAIDDGDDNHLSLGERLWEGVKGAGKAVENFIGSQGLAFMGAMMLGSYVAGLAGIGKIFNLVTKGYFLFQGTKLAVKGTKEFVQADTKDGAKNGATTATTGGIMLFGTIKGLIKDIKGMRTEYQAKQTAKAEFNSQVESSRAKLEIPEGELLSEVTLKKAYRQAAFKNHPDKGGSEAAMAEVTAAYEFLLNNLKSAQKVKTTSTPVTDVPVTEAVVNNTVNMSGEQGLVLASHYKSAAATSPVIIPLNPNPVSSTPAQTGGVKTVSIVTGVEIPTTAEGMRAAIENATDLDVLRSYRSGMKNMPSDVKALYVRKEQFLRENLLPERKAVFNIASATEEGLKKLPLDVLRDYTQIAKQLQNSDYIDIKLEWIEDKPVASFRFKGEALVVLDKLLDKNNCSIYYIKDNNAWIHNLQFDPYSKSLIYELTSDWREHDLIFKNDLFEYKTEEYEVPDVIRNGRRFPPIGGNIQTRDVPANSFTDFYDNKLKAAQEKLEKRYEKMPDKDNYIIMMQTLYVASKFDQFMPELVRITQKIENTKNLNEQEQATLLKACLSGDYSEIKENTFASKESNKESVEEAENKITFKDVGGQDEAIQEMERGILFPLLYPDAFKNNSIKHGFILYGPPGTGKSLMAEALANESGAYFIKVNAGELNNKYVGGTEENWRNLFEEASKNQPAIIFMDEFDAIAKQRGGQDEYGDKALNQILALISDVEKKRENIYFIGATNREDILDDAITRSGRFGKSIIMTVPDTVEKVEAIFNIHSKNQPLDINLNKTEIFEKLLSIEATGADIAAVVYDAGEYAKERNGIYDKMKNRTFKMSDMDNVKVTQEDFNRAIKELAKQKVIDKK